MELRKFRQRGPFEWALPATGRMRVPGVIFASRELMEAMDEKVAEQVANVANLPGIVAAAYAMPDAHSGYGFPIGGVAAFDADEGGVVSAGGVGFDISCGVRTLHTGLKLAEVEAHKKRLADVLYARIPAGVGSTGALRLSGPETDAMLKGGAGRAMSRNEALRRWHGSKVVDELAARGILIRSPSVRGVAEEAPLAYKDVDAVVDAADRAGLAIKVLRLAPLVCIKG
ncbi:hypothetical protein AzCIB_1013 [Azoarcus sp. CIB]|uniref:RNA-splicing ligase RtcB n=1 Tax=Aromatoleum sp. (strain CIB) TaxID=198107 RepID=UPI00067ACE92|nr:RNA-splicing ligase RtcB [Azoarcus sp. CIB]AKU10918.1 hypothetical protein AzCIB_1013 [Azoarcus sp. CIB]